MSMTTTFATATETTSYRDRTAVMVEADYQQETGGSVQQQWVTLTRLDNDRHSGVALDENALTMVQTLSKELGRLQTKQVSVSPDTLRRMGRRPLRVSGLMTDPLGPYYTKLSMDFSIYGTAEINKAWDENPIEAVELSMIPGNVTPDKLRSHRLGRCLAVTLHFQNPSFSEVFGLLVNPGIKLESCRVLELRNINASESQVAALKMRLQWPCLTNVLLAKRS